MEHYWKDVFLMKYSSELNNKTSQGVIQDLSLESNRSVQCITPIRHIFI